MKLFQYRGSKCISKFKIAVLKRDLDSSGASQSAPGVGAASGSWHAPAVTDRFPSHSAD